MALTLAIAGVLIVALTAVLSFVQAKPQDRTRAFIALTIVVAVVQVLVIAAQWVNTELVEQRARKRHERETALALWAFRDQRVKELTKLTEDHPYLLGYYHFKQGEYALANESLDEAIAQGQYVAAARYVKAVIIRLQNGDLTQARTEIEAALAYDPEYSVLYVERGLQELMARQIATGLASFEHAITSSRVHCASLASIGNLGQSVLELVQAEPSYQSLLVKCGLPAPTVAVAQGPVTHGGAR